MTLVYRPYLKLLFGFVQFDWIFRHTTTFCTSIYVNLKQAQASIYQKTLPFKYSNASRKHCIFPDNYCMSSLQSGAD